MNLTTLKCPACAAVLNIDTNQSIVTCEYCKNCINIIKPVKSNDIVDGLNDMEQKRYSNYLSILNQTMLAGNFKEANDYCNKALEINPKASSLWENKAICAFWLSTIAELAEEKVNEIITYLNASKQNDPDSSTYIETTNSIADNLFYCILYKYHSIRPDEFNNGRESYSFKQENVVLSCIRVSEMCYQIFPNIKYLTETVKLIVDDKIGWFLGFDKLSNSDGAKKHNFDAVRKRDLLLKKIQEINEKDPEYIKKTLKEKEEKRINEENSKIEIKWMKIYVFIFLGAFIIITLIFMFLFDVKSDLYSPILFGVGLFGAAVGAIIGYIIGGIKVKEFRKKQ